MTSLFLHPRCVLARKILPAAILPFARCRSLHLQMMTVSSSQSIRGIQKFSHLLSVLAFGQGKKIKCSGIWTEKR